jgi:hypothetical protein
MAPVSRAKTQFFLQVYGKRRAPGKKTQMKRLSCQNPRIFTDLPIKKYSVQ